MSQLGPEITLNAKFVFEVADKPRPGEFGDKSCFLKLDISAEGITTNDDLFEKIFPQIAPIEIASALHGNHNLKDYLTAARNAFGEQKPHIAIGWYSGFHLNNDITQPFNEEIVANAQRIADAQKEYTFTLNLNEFNIISASGLEAEDFSFNEGASFAKSAGLGPVRDTLFGWNLPADFNKKILKIAKGIYGDEFEQKDRPGPAGKPVPFYLTVAQGLVKPRLQPAPAITSARENFTQSMTPTSDLTENVTAKVDEKVRVRLGQ